MPAFPVLPNQLESEVASVSETSKSSTHTLTILVTTNTMIKQTLIVTGYLLLALITTSHTAKIGKAAILHKLCSMSYASSAHISESEVNNQQMQLNRCINSRGGLLLWMSDRKAYLDNLYICATKKSFLRWGLPRSIWKCISTVTQTIVGRLIKNYGDLI